MKGKKKQHERVTEFVSPPAQKYTEGPTNQNVDICQYK